MSINIEKLIDLRSLEKDDTKLNQTTKPKMDNQATKPRTTYLRKLTKDMKRIFEDWQDIEISISPHANLDYDPNNVAEKYTQSYHDKQYLKFIERRERKLDKINGLIQNGRFDDRKYHADMFRLYRILFGDYAYDMNCGNKIRQSMKQFERQVIKPYPRNLRKVEQWIMCHICEVEKRGISD